MPVWNESLATRISEIDDQHKELIKRINHLLDAGRQGMGRREIGQVMQFLDDYIRSHFSMEGGHMIRNNYVDYETHEARHDGFKKGFSKLRSELETIEESVGIVVGTNRLLGDWWINHIGTMDKALGTFLRTEM